MNFPVIPSWAIRANFALVVMISRFARRETFVIFLFFSSLGIFFQSCWWGPRRIRGWWMVNSAMVSPIISCWRACEMDSTSGSSGIFIQIYTNFSRKQVFLYDLSNYCIVYYAQLERILSKFKINENLDVDLSYRLI